MNDEHNSPIISSRHHGGKKPKGKNPIIVAISIMIFMGSLGAYFFIQENAPTEAMDVDGYYDTVYDLEKEAIKEDEATMTVPVPDVEELTPVELATANEYYKRALQKEKDKDYTGAIEDYTSTIALAKKYSVEMWNALNNRGIIKAEQKKDYKGAMKDFSKIISIELNRYNGVPNDNRLEAGYTNRAYVKKMRGDKEGACDDLYEALALGVESSIIFIEKQIDENCL